MLRLRCDKAYDTVQLLQGGFRSLRAHTELWDVRHLRHAPNAQGLGTRRAAVAILVSMGSTVVAVGRVVVSRVA